MRLIWVLLFVSGSVLANRPMVPVDQVDGILQLVSTSGAPAAMAAVEAYGVTAYDFGLDLAMADRQHDALQWFELAARATTDRDRFLFGKAWVQMSLNEYRAALTTAYELGDSVDPVVIARSHYLLAVIYFSVGNTELGQIELDTARDHYFELGKMGGVDLCNVLSSRIEANKSESAGHAGQSSLVGSEFSQRPSTKSFGHGGDPPTDRGESIHRSNSKSAGHAGDPPTDRGES